LIIKKKDNNSILPIIIKILSVILELVNKLLNSILFKPYKFEEAVLVKVKTDNLKEFSKLILSNNKTLDKNKILIKKEIKTKKDNFIFSLFISFIENNIF
jgi:hypothetical protein